MAKLEFENHKNQYFSWLLRSEQVKPIFLEIVWQNWPFKIGLSLFDFMQILVVDSGTIVHCTAIVKPNQNIYKLWDSSAVHSRTAEEEHRECSSLRPSQLSFFPWCHGPSHCTVLHTTGAMVPPPTSSSQPTQPTILYTDCTKPTHSAHSSNTQHCQLPAHGNPTWGKLFKWK